MMYRARLIKIRQTGYILITVMILLSVLMLMSLQFMGRSVTTSKISGYNRDAAESLLLAENAINWLYGHYANGNDLDNNGLADNASVINLSAPNPLPLHYMYFVSQGDRIDQTQPDLLQKIADGEARDGKEGVINRSKVSYDSVFLKVKNLYQSNSAPIILTQSASGISQSQLSWDNVKDTRKAAVWLELIRDVERENKIIVVAQAAAQSGKSKSYIQRFIGTYSDTLGRFNIAGISQANAQPPGQR